MNASAAASASSELLVFAKLIRISIADILVVSVITMVRCKTEPKVSPVDEISNFLSILAPFCH